MSLIAMMIQNVQNIERDDIYANPTAPYGSAELITYLKSLGNDNSNHIYVATKKWYGKGNFLKLILIVHLVRVVKRFPLFHV